MQNQQTEELNSFQKACQKYKKKRSTTHIKLEISRILHEKIKINAKHTHLTMEEYLLKLLELTQFLKQNLEL